MIFFPGHLRCYLPVSKFFEKDCHKTQSVPDAITQHDGSWTQECPRSEKEGKTSAFPLQKLVVKFFHNVVFISHVLRFIICSYVIYSIPLIFVIFLHRPYFVSIFIHMKCTIFANWLLNLRVFVFFLNIFHMGNFSPQVPVTNMLWSIAVSEIGMKIDIYSSFHWRFECLFDKN